MKKILLFFLLLLLSGCFAKREFIENDIRYDATHCIFALDTIAISDERPGTSDAFFSFKFWSKPGTECSVQQKLSDAHRRLITGEIGKHVAGPDAGDHRLLKVFVVSAEKKYAVVSRWSGCESAHVVLRMELWHKGAATFSKAMTGDSYFEVRSLTGSNEYVEQVFQKAIRASISQCFEGFRKE